MFEHQDVLAALNGKLPLPEKIEYIHGLLKDRFDFIDRISVAIYDPKTDLLKTFVHSSDDKNPFVLYSANLADSASMQEILKAGRPRVVNDLDIFSNVPVERERRIAALRYRSSYTMPMFLNGEFFGFLFFNSCLLYTSLDPVADWGMCGNSEEVLLAFVRQLASDGTDVQKARASELEQAWTDSSPEGRFEKLWPLLFTQKNDPRTGSPFSPSSKQKPDAEPFLRTRDLLQASLQEVRDTLAEQQAYRLNEAVLHCGVAFLERYQALKQQKQQMDFSDLEWQLCRLLQQSEHAETMQYKLDSRYRHVLLDEFQDTNPLQWQIMRAWFDAAVAVDSQPTVFIVGDPKQSIYRFRRADARLFGVAREYLNCLLYTSRCV